jgi:hopene-associated glycosyltransferase HpnB
MRFFLLIAALLPACIWTYLVLARGFFWRVDTHIRVPRSSRGLARPGIPSNGTTRIIAIIPARNEAATIARTLTSLLQQTTPNLDVIVVDDASTDRTSDAARTAAADLGFPNRLTVLSGKPLLSGWTGKLWAVHQGIELALQSRPDFLLFTDADIEHGPQTVANLIDIAESGPFDLTSYMVKLHCTSIAEKLLVPAFVYFFFQLYPPRWISDPQSHNAGAAGGCMLVRPSALVRAGGIEAIRSAIIDDCALARAIKDSGGRVWLGLTNDGHSIRPYRSFAEIGRMISRTAFNQLRHSTLLLFGTVLGLIVTYLLPIAVLGCRTLDGFARVGFPVLALALMFFSYLPMVRFYRLNPVWALSLPLASIFYMGATIWSAIQYWSGRGGQWKGRAQDSSRAATP